jgi:hypothetical protein
MVDSIGQQLHRVLSFFLFFRVMFIAERIQVVADKSLQYPPLPVQPLVVISKVPVDLVGRNRLSHGRV